MAKSVKRYACRDCGAVSAKWQGQCAACGAWNTLEEVSGPLTGGARASGGGYAGQRSVANLADVGDGQTEAGQRRDTGFGEFDRVLGGGVVRGAVVLLGGDPGVGKSTLLLQVTANLSKASNVLYVTGEESVEQVANRARRLGVADCPLTLLAEVSVETIIATAAANRADMLVVDSMQTLVAESQTGNAGAVSQLRECVGQLTRFAKTSGTSVFIVGHVTKEGVIAGPRVVEHMVDTVLYFESDPASRFSIVRAVKNRFGAASEMGMFAMQEDGFHEVSNPSAIFLSRDSEPVAGSLVTVTWEGSRPLLVEVQALVADTHGGQPRRLAQGMEQNRLSLLLAVLQRHGGLSLAGEDVFINVVGGIRIHETAADLPALLATVSSFRDRTLNTRLISFGEVGLAGEVRPVRFGEERLREAAKQGFTAAIVPRGNQPRKPIKGLQVHPITRLQEALAIAFD
ncbi:MAG: DNA repair protein RadA [Pseudomonadota bacterium]